MTIMLKDVDRLMKAQQLDGLLVSGATAYNPAMYYFTHGIALGEGTLLIKKQGKPAVLIVNPMEREEAVHTGLPVKLSSNYASVAALARARAKGNPIRARALFLAGLLAGFGITGTLAVAGRLDSGDAFETYAALRAARRGGRVVSGDHLMTAARVIKGPDEIARIKAVGKKTLAVVGDIHDFLGGQRAKGGYLVTDKGRRVTIGDVKRRIHQKLAEQGVVDAENGAIFAQGRDAGIPHSRGDAKQPLKLGETLIFDIFPAEPGGGYFFDFTRTWCLGHASDTVLAAHTEVREIFRRMKHALKINVPTRDYQQATNDYFEAKGHPTANSHPGTTSGYVHSLGHGIGLDIHEAPSLSLRAPADEVIKPGMVFTVEPGLYYPDRGYGIRIEDTVWVNPTTRTVETIGRYPEDLVIPVRAL
jgi:Xaa-Pro aminopeptidase